MSNKSAKFRAWSNPQYLHYGGYRHFEQVSDKNDANPKTRALAGKNSRFKSGRSSHADDKVRLAREHARSRGKYSDPKTYNARPTDESRFLGPQWSTEFKRQDVEHFRMSAARKTPSRRSRRGGTKSRPRSRQYDPTDPRGGTAGSRGLDRPSSRATTASQSSLVYVKSGQMPRRSKSSGALGRPSSSIIFDMSATSVPKERAPTAPAFFRGASAVFPPLPRHPATYGRNVNVLDQDVARHLVRKQHGADIAARQRAMLQNAQGSVIWDEAPTRLNTAMSRPFDVTASQSSLPPHSPMVWPPPGAMPDGGTAGANDGPASPSLQQPGAGDERVKFSKVPAFQPPTTSTMRVERSLAGRAVQRVPRGTAQFGNHAPNNAPPPAVLDFSQSIDDMRVLHAAANLRGSLRFGEDLMEKVDVPQRHPAISALPRSSAGMAALSSSSLFSPDPTSWATFAAQPLRPHPAVVKFGPLKCGVSYAFPATVRNHGLVARRLRVAGTHVLAESSPAEINVRYSSIRLAAGMSATVDILLTAEVPGKVVAQVEMSSEDDYFIIPVTATFLSHDGFLAAMEKARHPRRGQHGSRADATDNLLIPGATHKQVMVVIEPKVAEHSPNPALAVPTGERTIVEEMEAKLRAAGYSPKPIRSRGSGTADPAASVDGDELGDADTAVEVQDADVEVSARHHGGVMALIRASETNESARHVLDTAARHIERAARGHLGRRRVQRIKAGAR